MNFDDDKSNKSKKRQIEDISPQEGPAKAISPQTKKYKDISPQTKKYKEGLEKAIIPLIVSTHGNYIVDRESELQIIDFSALLPPGSSDDYTIWTWTFMPILGNPATHIKETMDLMYLSRDFFLQLFSLNLEYEYFTRYIQEAQYIVSRNYMSIMIPQIYASLKQTYDALWFNIYKELFYDMTRRGASLEITPNEALEIIGDLRNNSEKLKDFLNNLLGFQDPSVVKNLMWLVKTDKTNQQFLLKEFTTNSTLLKEKYDEQYKGSGQDPWDITKTYQGKNTVLFGDIENGKKSKGKKSTETHYNKSNQDLINEVILEHSSVKNILIVDASCAHLQKINKNAVVDRFIIAKEQQLIESLFPNKITMTQDNAIKIAGLVKVMLEELNFSLLLQDCNNILRFLSNLKTEDIFSIKQKMITKIGKQLTKPNIDSMTFFNENSILVTKTLKEILNPELSLIPRSSMRRSNSVFVASASQLGSEPVKGKSSTMPTSNRGLLSSIAGVDVIGDVGVRMTKIKLDEILEEARAPQASSMGYTAAAAAATMDDDTAGGSRRKRSRRRKNGSKKSMKRKKTRASKSQKKDRMLRRRRITRKRIGKFL
jgi:hypothetical protein